MARPLAPSTPSWPPRPVATLLLLALACGDGEGDDAAGSATGAITSASASATVGGSGSTTMTTMTTTTDAATTSAATVATTDATTTAATTTAATTTAATSDPTGPDTVGTTTGDPDTTTGPSPDLCMPAGNLLAVGGLDEGMAGDAPVGWEVRSPGQPEACAGSGPHVFASAPAPGCAGGAITVDANGVWDCYAVQTVSPYNSIEGGATYEIRAAVRSQGNAVNPAAWFILGAQWLDENDGFFGDEKNPQPMDPADNDFEWRILSWEVVAPANARRILVWMTAHVPGQVEYDHVAVIKKG